MLCEGEVRYSSGAEQIKYTYTGQYSYTNDFGLHFYNAHWYDTSLGRFTQADSIIPAGVQGLDRYAYVNNAPVNLTDPSGHMVSGGLNGEGGGSSGDEKPLFISTDFGGNLFNAEDQILCSNPAIAQDWCIEKHFSQQEIYDLVDNMTDEGQLLVAIGTIIAIVGGFTAIPLPALGATIIAFGALMAFDGASEILLASQLDTSSVQYNDGIDVAVSASNNELLPQVTIFDGQNVRDHYIWSFTGYYGVTNNIQNDRQ